MSLWAPLIPAWMPPWMHIPAWQPLQAMLKSNSVL
jgi:hypothetical protein